MEAFDARKLFELSNGRAALLSAAYLLPTAVGVNKYTTILVTSTGKMKSSCLLAATVYRCHEKPPYSNHFAGTPGIRTCPHPSKVLLTISQYRLSSFLRCATCAEPSYFSSAAEKPLVLASAACASTSL